MDWKEFSQEHTWLRQALQLGPKRYTDIGTTAHSHGRNNQDFLLCPVLGELLNAARPDVVCGIPIWSHFPLLCPAEICYTYLDCHTCTQRRYHAVRGRSKKQHDIFHQHPQHHVARQLFLSFRKKNLKIITVGRNSVYILMHCFARNPCMTHSYKKKWAQVPFQCLCRILSLSSQVYFLVFVPQEDRPITSHRSFILKEINPFQRSVKTSS